MGPDGKIYMPMAYSGMGYYYNVDQNLYLSVINQPNEAGLACDFDTLSVWLGGNRATYSLPNICDYSLGPLAGSECDTTGVAINEFEELNNEITIYPNPAHSVLLIKANNYFTGKVEIYNFQGTLLAAIDDIHENSEISLANIPAGMYICKITTDDLREIALPLIINQ